MKTNKILPIGDPPPLTDLSQPWGVVEFIDKDGKIHKFSSAVNEMSGDRLSWFDNNPPRVGESVADVYKVFVNIKKKSVRVIKYYGTRHFML